MSLLPSPSLSPPPRAPLRRLRVALWLALAAIALSALVAVCIDAEVDYRETLEQTERRTESTAALLDQHVRQTLHAADFVLGQAIELSRQGPPDQATWRRLHDLEAGLPERGRLLIFDADGNLVLDSRAFPAPQYNISGQPRFQAHRQGNPFIVTPMANAPIGDCLHFTVSRPIVDKLGHMLGIASAAIDVANFSDHYKALDLGEGGIIAVFDREGGIILRQPNPERFQGRNIVGGVILGAVVRSPQGFLPVSPSKLDGIERLVAYRALDEFGLVAVAGIATDEALAGWWRARVITLAALSVFALILAALAALAFRGLNREQAMMRDLERTVRDRTEEARLQAEAARRANEDKTRFLAAASHDLRQPLQAAGMFVEVLAARLTATPHQGVVEKLRQSIEATGTLLSTLLDVSTLEAGKVQPNVTAFPLMPLLASLADQMEPEAAARHLRLKVAVTSAWVVSDRVLLERLLRNFLVNALRYTSRGGVLLGCRRRSGGQLLIVVVDTGIGVPDDKREMIFDDFTRLENSLPSIVGSRGPGLGLGVVRRMAQLLGHKIEVRSIVGKGSSFGVLVPSARPRRIS